MANETVLVLDDDHDFLSALGELLEAEGFRPRLFRNARDALAGIREWPPSLLLTDAPLPWTQSGVLLSAIRADPELRDLPSIVFTGWSASSVPPFDGVRIVYKPDLASLMARSGRSPRAVVPALRAPFQSIARCRELIGPLLHGGT